jgi:hypothetical protein
MGVGPCKADNYDAIATGLKITNVIARSTTKHSKITLRMGNGIIKVIAE